MATQKSYSDKIIEDAGLSPVKAEELQAKFDAQTKAEYDKQRTALQNTENKFYNQLYDTQQTTMDTIRQANAQAVATGASRGVQAANELSALLGLQQESVEGATDIANQATTLAQDETQAMLENVLNAETTAAEQNQNLANILVQAGSVDVENRNANTAAIQALTTAEAQARADGNIAQADAYRQAINNLLATNTSTTTGTGTGTGTDSTTTNTAYAYTSTEDLYKQLNAKGVQTGQQKVIDTNLAQSTWGDLIKQADFNSTTSKGKAGEYIETLVEDAKEGKIPVGSYVQFNYGDKAGNANYSYMYIGNGRFAKVIYSEKTTGPVYIPAGYTRKNANGPQIRVYKNT